MTLVYWTRTFVYWTQSRALYNQTTIQAFQTSSVVQAHVQAQVETLQVETLQCSVVQAQVETQLETFQTSSVMQAQVCHLDLLLAFVWISFFAISASFLIKES